MKVLYVNHTSQMSGAEYALLTLLDGLPAHVEPIVACPPGPLAEEVRARDLELVAIPEAVVTLKLHPWRTPLGLAGMARVARMLRRIARDRNVEIVHANAIRAGLIALPARRRSRPPVVVHIRDSLPEGLVSALTLRLLSSRASAVLPISRYAQRGLEKANSHIVHDAVDCGAFDPDRQDRMAARGRLGLADGDAALGIVAQITPWKGQDDAVRTLARVKEFVPRSKLLIVGSPKFVTKVTRYDNRRFLRDVEELIGRLGLRDDVVLLGERTDVAEIVGALDVLLVPSWAEPFGRTVLEGMAMRVPVAATSVGGPAEVVRDGIEGLLLPPRRPDIWGEAIAELLQDQERRRQMGVRGRARACREFSVEAHVRAILAVYESLLAPPRGSAP